MRLVAAALATVLPFLGTIVVTQAIATPSESGAYHVVVPRRAVDAGERVKLRLEPPAPVGLRANYWVVVGTGAIGLNPPVYRAPYVIPPGTPPARVGASFSGQGVRASAWTEIELRPGSVPGAEDCLGPGESFSTAWGDITYGANFYVDALPELILTVEPQYPRRDFVRGVEDTIFINALVCRSGRVLGAYASQRYRDRNLLEPIEDDPKLVDAAIAAVRQYVFHPASSYGQPVAVWVATP